MSELTELERMVRPGCCFEVLGPGHICGMKPYAEVHRPGSASRFAHNFRPEPEQPSRTEGAP